jgi:WD40 repeat protein
MRRVISLALFILAIVGKAYPQEVDLVRLGYAPSAVSAKQIGMAVSADGNLIAFVYNDKTIKIFDIAANKFVKRFIGPYATVFDVQITPTKIILISLNEVQVWSWKEEQLAKTFKLTNQATKTAFSGKHNLLAVGQKEGTVAVINVEKAEQLNELVYKMHHISALAFHPNGKSIIVGVMTFLKSLNPLKQFDIATGNVIASSSAGIYSMAVYNDAGTELVTSGMNGLGLKTVITIFDGTDLSFLNQHEMDLIVFNALIPYGGIVADKKFLSITASSSFNVNDLLSGQRVFTTKSDKYKLPAYGILGVGSFNVYPLSKNKVLFNGSKNNINQIYDVKTNSIVGYFFSDSNDDFAVVSRDGRVDGTPEALAKVYWTSKNSSKKTSLESTFEKGFTPKLLGGIVGDKAMPQQEFKVEQVVAKIPVISLQSFNGKAPGTTLSAQSQLKAAKFDIQVKENPQEITELKLFQNAKLVKTLPGNGSSKYSFEATLNTSFGEDNYFYITASSKSGIESEKIKFTVLYKGATEDKPKLYLVTIGINKYKNAKYNLNYAEADADGVEKAVKTNSGTLFKEVVTYNIRNDKAVKANILVTLDDIKKKSLQQDVLLVYYAGHGVMTQGENGEFYIVPHDIIQLYGKDDILKEKGISATMLKQYAQEINAQKQVFILDACQSAGALETVAVRGAAEEKAIAQLARSTGTFWITATGSNQFATEFEKLGHGIFTYALLEGITGAGDANNDKKLTVRELSTFIENKVPELSEKYKGTAQFPSAYSFGNDFPIVIYKE